MTDTIAGMRSLLLASVLLLSVSLDAPFVSAEATALRVDATGVLVEARVVTDQAATVVLVRAVGPDEQTLEPVAMEPRGSVWVARLQLPRRSDVRLAFEHIDPDGTSIVSRPAALIELGVDAAIFSLDEVGASDAGESAGGEELAVGRRWGWLVVALTSTTVALVLLAIWWRRDTSETDTQP